jgi:hypothetical protein
LVEAATYFDGLLELIQIQGTLVHARESVQVGAMLFVKLGQLVEIIQVCTGS